MYLNPKSSHLILVGAIHFPPQPSSELHNFGSIGRTISLVGGNGVAAAVVVGIREG